MFSVRPSALVAESSFCLQSRPKELSTLHFALPAFHRVRTASLCKIHDDSSQVLAGKMGSAARNFTLPLPQAGCNLSEAVWDGSPQWLPIADTSDDTFQAASKDRGVSRL